MAEGERQVDHFAIPEFWQTSKWIDKLDRDGCDGSDDLLPFFTPLLKDGSSTGLFKISNVSVDNEGFFKPPPLHDAEIESLPPSEDAQTAEKTTDEHENLSDLWIQSSEKPKQAPAYRTWDAFISKSAASTQPPLVTEAGPAVYDALLCWAIDPLEMRNSDVVVVEAKPYFASLLSLAVGQESLLFKRQEDAQSFTSVLPKMRISGLSQQALQGMENQSLACGRMFLQLRSFVRTTYRNRSSKCGVALASALDQILKDSQQHVSVDGSSPRSLLQLQSTVKGLLTILKPLQRLTSKLQKGYSDEDVLSRVFHEAYSVDYGEEQLREITREVLRRVSRPWLEFLEEWIGTRREEGIPLAKHNVGESKGFVKVAEEIYIDDFGHQVQDVDFRLDSSKMPHFMPHDIAKSIFETGKNLRFIRTSHPEHPLAKPDALTISQPPEAKWLYDWDAIRKLENECSEYQKRVLQAIRDSRSHQQGTTRQSRPAQFTKSETELRFFGIQPEQIEERFMASIKTFNQPMSDLGSEDPLSRVVRQRLSKSFEPSPSSYDFAPHWSLLPVLSFGGIASVQSQIVNQESLRLLFSEHGLRAHLNIHRDFHLFGDGMFCSRLSHALFDPDLETAERTAKVARQGGVMGLRLGGRDTWPPASSELRLALMGVLSESFGPEHGLSRDRHGTISRDASDLPGDLSFAVRDLSQEEIDKCMNADSLEALDFLRLSYKPPAPLASMMTPMILTQYDRIFKLLLRVLRLLYVVNQLFRDVNSRTSRWQDPDDCAVRFSREAQHFVSGIASFFLDVGVSVPWQTLEDKLDTVQSNLENFDVDDATEKAESPDRLREFHSRVLDRIMSALFLRKRQQPVLKLLEDIFTGILEYAKHSRLQGLGRNDDDEQSNVPREMYKSFKKKVQIFITVCRGLTEKGRSAESIATGDRAWNQGGGIGEDHMIAQLLMKLEMNDYYTKR